MTVNKIDTWLDLFDAWVEAKFGYAIHAVRFSVGCLSLIIGLDYVYPGYLVNRTLTFSNPMPVAEFMGYSMGAATMILIFYFTGMFWINVGKAIIHKLTKEKDDAVA